MAKSEVAKAVVKCAAMAGEPITEWSPTGLVTQRFAEHAMRVSGAQMLARAGVSLHLIKLLGRWGSDAVERYVQDAALCRQTLLASQNMRTGSGQHPRQRFNITQLQQSTISKSSCNRFCNKIIATKLTRTNTATQQKHPETRPIAEPFHTQHRSKHPTC